MKIKGKYIRTDKNKIFKCYNTHYDCQWKDNPIAVVVDENVNPMGYVYIKDIIAVADNPQKLAQVKDLIEFKDNFTNIISLRRIENETKLKEYTGKIDKTNGLLKYEIIKILAPNDKKGYDFLWGVKE